MEKKFVKTYLIVLGALLLAAALTVIFFDPFYHYHGKLPFLKAVLDDRDYQVKGTLDHFDYDSVVLGTSLAENTNTDDIRNLFGVSAVKAIRAGGSNADLMVYLDEAFDHTDVKEVFYYLDYASMTADARASFNDSEEKFIVNDNPLDDVKYLINKDVLLNKIPKQIAYSTIADYNEAEPYAWYAEKTFAASEILSRYYPLESVASSVPVGSNESFYENISMLEERIKAHGETTFEIILPPVSILWWDNEYRNGMLDERMYETEYVAEVLGKYDNVHIYNYQFDTDIIADLDNYMDTVHFSNNINRRMYEEIAAGCKETDSDSVKEQTAAFKRTVIEFAQEKVYEYYPKP